MMFYGEAATIRSMLSAQRGRRILNIGSSCRHFYGVVQDHIWRDLLAPLGAADNEVINLDTKAADGVDIVADATAMPLDDASMDAVICANLLEHVKDPEAVIDEARRVLAPGGVAVFSAPGAYRIHPDPIDTGLRIATVEQWRDLFGDGWQVIRFAVVFDRRADEPIAPNIFATVVMARKA